MTPQEMLGVAREATEQEIHAAFHRLAMHYHPDKVFHLGEEFRQVAHQKFTELKAAYDVVLERRRRQR